MFDRITKENFIFFAIKSYTNKQCSGVQEFYEDLGKIKNLRKQLTRYTNTGEINERLFLNNLIMLFNVFEMDAACIMLLHKIPPESWSPLKTALNFLGYLDPRIIPEISEELELRTKLDRL